jgi:hypothetical protein
MKTARAGGCPLVIKKRANWMATHLGGFDRLSAENAQKTLPIF